MSCSRRWSRSLGAGSSVLLVSAIASWAAARTTANLAAAVVLTGVAGVVTFAASLSPLFAPRRHRTMATGLVLVGTAAVLASLDQAVGYRTGFLAICGAGLFCAAELGDRAFCKGQGVQYRSGVDRWWPVWVSGVASGGAGLSYGAISARNILAGGGPAALVLGTVSATLVAFLALVLSTRARSSP